MFPALYRPHYGEDWQEVDVLGRHKSGCFVVREVGPTFPGVMLATISQVRVPTGEIADIDRQAEHLRLPVPYRKMPDRQRITYRKLRRLGVPQAEALAVATQ